MANGGKKHMDADENGQASQGEQGNSQEKYVQDFRGATGDRPPGPT